MNKSKKEAEKGLEGKIIFVNSLKGGAGKTTFTLSHCIDALFHEKAYQNVIYIDLDILGTATCYLFEEGRLPREKCFDYTRNPVKIELELEGEQNELYVAYLNPDFKNRASYGEDYYFNHQLLALEHQKQDILDFIRECLDQEPQTLLVLDCAPGFSELEQALLAECYRMAEKKKGKLKILEEYVMTLDFSHVKKGIQCLKNSQTSFDRQMKNRSIRITLNDIQNFTQWMQGDEPFDVQKVWLIIAKELQEELDEKSVEIFRWQYSARIAQGNTFTMKENVENQLDDYLFTEDSYKEIK